MELILFFVVLLRRENVNMSLDLKFEMRIASRSNDPMRTRIFCFLGSATFEPSRKKSATEPSTAAIITIDKLRIIIIIKIFRRDSLNHERLAGEKNTTP